MIYPSHPSYPKTVPGTRDPQQMPVLPTHGGGVKTGAVHRPKEVHYDPAGKPIEFNSGSVCDQQAGGDLSCREPDTRDDNFIDDADSAGMDTQLERDMGTEIDDFRKIRAKKPAPPFVEPDGTEDPLAGIDKA
ncbi:MAG TPA: hypothetical protein VGM52_05890 [Herbaspirillum sp.]|jgi:hypothetical protein